MTVNFTGRALYYSAEPTSEGSLGFEPSGTWKLCRPELQLQGYGRRPKPEKAYAAEGGGTGRRSEFASCTQFIQRYVLFVLLNYYT
jgi:hypothetical protein